jgi:ATP/maltotriose-dependent transcriptional regulator MalT
MTLYLPETDPERLVDRASLRLILDDALHTRLSVIVAPAGYGKTTLLQQWSHTHPELTSVTLTLENDDNDPDHFVNHLGARLRVATGAPELPEDRRLVTLIDDLQRVTNRHTHALLADLIHYAPGSTHFVVSSRTTPPLALSRYRLADDLREIGQEALAFTEPDAASLLENVVGEALAPKQVKQLWLHTEGWAAGLQLAALSLRDQLDTAVPVADINGSTRLIADYFREEVFSPLPPERQQILLELSALDTLCADLITAAIGIPHAESVVTMLQRESLFVVIDADRRGWFRFHRLFAEFLRSRLRADDPTRELAILQSAAQWRRDGGRIGHNQPVVHSPAARGVKASADSADILIAGGRAHFVAGDMREARGWLSRGVIAAGGDVRERIAAISALSLVEAWSGNNQTAAALVAETLQTARSAGMLTHPCLADAQLAAVLTSLAADNSSPGSAVQHDLVLAWLANNHHLADRNANLVTELVDEAPLPPSQRVQAGLTAGGPSPADYELLDPLTARELEILAYLPTRFSNIEIARRFYVSVNTVKTHIAHIYRKLDVADRDAAIDRAKTLGML